MQIGDFTTRVARAAESLGLRYYITGSVASMAWGVIRTTEDVDVVIGLTAEFVPAFCKLFEDLYVDEVGAMEAVRTQGSFNIIAPEWGLKVDLYVAGKSPTEELRMRRARREEVREGVSAQISSPEDCILSKMEFFRMGGSQKHVRDIFGILGVQANLDLAYIDRSAEALGLAEIWGELKAGRRPRHESDTY